MAMRGAGMTSISGLLTAPESWIWPVLRALAPNLSSWLPSVEDYALAQEGTAARPYIWRLIIVKDLVDVAFHGGGGAAGQGQPGGNGLLAAHSRMQIITFCMRHAGGRRYEPGEPNGGSASWCRLSTGHGGSVW
jgi:hypothetical protein